MMRGASGGGDLLDQLVPDGEFVGAQNRQHEGSRSADHTIGVVAVHRQKNRRRADQDRQAVDDDAAGDDASRAAVTGGP